MYNINVLGQNVTLTVWLTTVCIYMTHDFQVKRTELRSHIIQTYKQTANKEHQRILQRRQIIEERKEEIETLNVKRVKIGQKFPEIYYVDYQN